MKRRKPSVTALYIIAVVLLVAGSAVVYADFMLLRVFQEQQKSMRSLMQADAIPVLQPVLQPTPVLAPDILPTPEPVRTPLAGDIPDVRFPAYDTGVGAKHSYQSDELRIAVHEVQEDGVTYYLADIWMRNINCFRTAFSSGKYRGKREPAEKIAQDNNAILAVNGDFLGGLVLRNGVLYQKANLRPVPTPEAVTETETNPDTGLPEAATGAEPGQNGDVPEAATPQPAPVQRPERATCVVYYDGTMVTEE